MKEIKVAYSALRLIAQVTDIYQLRLLGWAFVKAQATVQKIDRNLDKINLQHIRDIHAIELPVSLITTDTSHARAHITRACELQDKTFQAYYDSREITIKAIAFPRLVKRADGWKLQYYIHDSLWLALIDLSHGWRKIDITSMTKIHRTTTMALYFLISKQPHDITLTLDTFRDMLQLSPAYMKKSNLIARILEPAREELKDCATTFAYTFDTNTRGARSQTITLHPITQACERSEQAEQLAQRLQIDLPPETADYLTTKYGATDRDLRLLAPHLTRWASPYDQVAHLAEIHTAALRAGVRNPIAYLTAALQRQR